MQGNPAADGGPSPSDPAGPEPAAPSWPPAPVLRAHRHAVRAGLVQLASPFVFTGMVVLGLATGIAPPSPHGYAEIFSFFASIVLMVPMIAVAGTGLGLLSSKNRWGGVLVAFAAAVAALQSIGLVVGFPTGIGELVPIRVGTIVIGVVWLGVNVWCVVAGVRGFRRIPRRRPR